MTPYDKRSGKIWYNNELVDWADAKIHILNHGLHYASCVFEGERVYDGSIFKLEEHYKFFFFELKKFLQRFFPLFHLKKYASLLYLVDLS